MYIIDDTYFQAPNREIPNLDEADSKAFAELERMIDNECRLLFTYFLTAEQIEELDGYLTDGIFPEDAQPDPLLPDYVPQKWISLVKGTSYTHNGVSLFWKGLIYERGTYKGSLLADYVYSIWLETQASYMTGVGDAKGQPKGSVLVNPTQRIVTVWNEFVKQYQTNLNGYCDWIGDYYYFNYSQYWKSNEVSLIQFLSDNEADYPNDNRRFFEVKNQLGL